LGDFFKKLNQAIANNRRIVNDENAMHRHVV
jgi:hypothetical protein